MSTEELQRYEVKDHTVKVSAASDPAKIVVYAMEKMDSGSLKEYVEFLCIGAIAQHKTAKAAVLLAYRIESSTPNVQVLFRLEKVTVKIADKESGQPTDTVATLWKTVIQYVSE